MSGRALFLVLIVVLVGCPSALRAATPLTLPPPAQHGPVLTEDDAIVLALAHSPQIAQAAKAADAARFRIGEQRAAFFPSLTASTSEFHNASGPSHRPGTLTLLGTGTSVVAGQGSWTNSDSYNGSLGFSITLFDFARRGLRVQSANAAFQAALQDLETARQDVIVNVRSLLYTARTDEEVLAIKQQTVRDREDHLKQAEGFYDAGVRAKIEVTKARADLATAQFDVVTAASSLRQAWVNLNVAMGLPQDEAYTLQMPPVEGQLVALKSDDLLKAAWRERSELISLREKARSAAADLEELYRSRLPTLSGSAGYGLNGPQFPLTESWNTGLTLSVNLFDGYQTHYQIQESRANLQGLLAQTEATRQKVYQDVRNNDLTLEAAWAHIRSARVSLESARENYDLARQRYKVGLGSNLEYADAQVLLAQAETDLVTAVNDYRTAQAKLARSVGVYSLDEVASGAR